MKVALLLVTITLAVALSLGMWAIGAVPLDFKTVTLHVVSIYIGVAGVLLFQRWFR